MRVGFCGGVEVTGCGLARGASKRAVVCSQGRRQFSRLNNVRTRLSNDQEFERIEEEVPEVSWEAKEGWKVSLAQQAAAPSPTLEKTSSNLGRGDDRKRQEFLANVGSVTRILREDYPRLLEKDPDLSMFTDNVLLRDQFNFSGMCVQGKQAYTYFFWGLRMRSKVLFKDSMVRLQNVFYDQQDGIYVRWQLYGVRRFSGWASLTSVDVSVEDGLSLYKLNEKGFVCEHIVVRVLPPKPKSFSQVLSWFSSILVPPVPAHAAGHCELEFPATSTSENNLKSSDKDHKTI